MGGSACNTFRVQATNSLGAGPLGPPMVWRDAPGSPSVPRNLTAGTAVDPSSGSDIIWAEFLDPLSDGGMRE